MQGATITLTADFVTTAIEAKLRALFKDGVRVKIESVTTDRYGQATVTFK